MGPSLLSCWHFATHATTMSAVPRYVRPGWFTVHVLNKVVSSATKRGVSIWGSRILRVPGRRTGEWRSVPVNLLTVGGDRYLVAPRGETQWVRNLRVAGSGKLVLGSSEECFSVIELSDSDKVEILRAYLKRWKAEVGVFFGGVSATSSDEELRRITPDHPVFRIVAGKR